MYIGGWRTSWLLRASDDHTGTNPQVLVNAVTVDVGTRINFSGFPTLQELGKFSAMQNVVCTESVDSMGSY
jgi:hypothetical protein